MTTVRERGVLPRPVVLSRASKPYGLTHRDRVDVPEGPKDDGRRQSPWSTRTGGNWRINTRFSPFDEEVRNGDWF